MAVPTLTALHAMQHAIESMERDTDRATTNAKNLRACGGYKTILDWHRQRTNGYSSSDYDGITKLIEESMAEFGPAILEILALRQEQIAHESMTQAVLKRAELGTFVSLAQPT